MAEQILPNFSEMMDRVTQKSLKSYFYFFIKFIPFKFFSKFFFKKKFKNMKEPHERVIAALNNPVFQKYPVLTNEPRAQLPVLKDPNEKLDIWTLLKDCIGEDLSRITLPVWLNEPLSIQQRIAEMVEYKHLLDKASEPNIDQWLRLAYATSFCFMAYSSTYFRVKKPFNPLLGETVEVTKENFRYVSEQVSHHPPICACYGESPDYKIWGDSRVTMNINFGGLDVNPGADFHIFLKKTKNHFVIKKPKITVKNIVLGKTYVWSSGDMQVENERTGDTLCLNFRDKGWTSSNDYLADGEIKDASGNVKYFLTGHWNKELWATCKSSGNVIKLAEKLPSVVNHEWQYHMPPIGIQMNHLIFDDLEKLCPTDSRLRPDQRALEYGDLELAKREKLRLEVKQRGKRKEREGKEEVYKSRWFEEEED